MKTEQLTELPASRLTRKQVKQYGPKPIVGYGTGAIITAEVRFDDECGNGHNSFAITAEVRIPGRRDIEAGGCMHEEIAKAFPELAPFIKWHLTSTDGPMHYPGNVTYMAGERDCCGTLKGEVKSWKRRIKHGHFPVEFDFDERFIKWLEAAGRKFVADCEVFTIHHKEEKGTNYKFAPKYTLGGYDAEWYQCPFDSESDALNFIHAAKEFGLEIVKTPDSYGEGKARELNSARHCAVWPEATDAELCQDKATLEAVLMSRLPALMADFKTAVESLGFTY